MGRGKVNAGPSLSSTSGRKHHMAECFARGEHLSKVDKNYDYAHALFADCVRQEPDNLQFVEAMIQNLRTSKPHVKKTAFSLIRGSSRELKRVLQRKEWTEVLRRGIELLKADPWDVTTLRSMAEACAALHHNEVELVYLKQALDADPKSIEVNRHCARSLGRMGQFDQAIACWHRVEKLKRKDDEAARMISFLAAEKFSYPGGRPPMVPTKEAAIGNPAPEVEPQTAPREIVLNPRQQLEQAVSRDPQNVDNYRELAELLLEAEQFNAAEAILSRAIGACGEQQTVQEQLKRIRSLHAAEQRRLAKEQRAQEELDNAPLRIPWLELMLGLAAVALIVQLVPAARAVAWNALDITKWGRTGWFIFNLAVLLILVPIRFAPYCRVWMRHNPWGRKRIPNSDR